MIVATHKNLDKKVSGLKSWNRLLHCLLASRVVLEMSVVILIPNAFHITWFSSLEDCLLDTLQSPDGMLQGSGISACQLRTFCSSHHLELFLQLPPLYYLFIVFLECT